MSTELDIPNDEDLAALKLARACLMPTFSRLVHTIHQTEQQPCFTTASSVIELRHPALI
jgi:hypothetical protein